MFHSWRERILGLSCSRPHRHAGRQRARGRCVPQLEVLESRELLSHVVRLRVAPEASGPHGARAGEIAPSSAGAHVAGIGHRGFESSDDDEAETRASAKTGRSVARAGGGPVADFSRLWSGVWHTTTNAERGPLGDITFTQTGDQVTGTYSQGTLNGTVRKASLVGSIQDNIAGAGSFAIHLDEDTYSSFVGSLRFNNNHTFTGDLNLASYSQGAANLTTVLTVKKVGSVQVGDIIKIDVSSRTSKNLGPEPMPAGGVLFGITTNASLGGISLKSKLAAHDCIFGSAVPNGSGVLCQMNSLGPASNKFGVKITVRINSVATNVLELRAGFLDNEGGDRADVQAASTGVFALDLPVI